MPSILPVRDLDGQRRNMVVGSDPDGEFPKHLAATSGDKFFASFAEFDTTADWEVLTVGAGMTIGVPMGGGALTSSPYLPISSGVTAGARTVILARGLYRTPIEVRVGMSASQRISNSTMRFGFLECDANGAIVTSTVFNTAPEMLNARNGCLVDFLGTNTGTVTIQSRQGGGGLDVTSSSLSGFTSAATGTAPNFIINDYVGISFERDRVAVRSFDGNVTNNSGTQLARDMSVPNPTKTYRFVIIIENGTTAPASSTDWRLHFVNILDATRFDVSPRHGGSIDQQRGFPVNVVNTANFTPNSGTEHAMVASLATTNATSVRTSTANLISLAITNLSANTRYLKVYRKATAPTVGTDIPIMTIPLPPNGFQAISFGISGLRLSTGIAYAITANAADNDTTAIGAGEIRLSMTYI